MTSSEINKKIASMRKHDGIDNDHPFSNEKNRLYNWAENIADAWELFEEMSVDSLQPPFLPSIKRQRESNKWMVHVITDHAHQNENCGFIFKTAPMAICLAWLEWKRNK